MRENARASSPNAHSEPLNWGASIGRPRTPGMNAIMPMKLSRFEKARIIGARALQISMGAPIMVGVEADLYDPIKIAELEFAADAIPITVRRAQEIDFKWDF